MFVFVCLFVYCVCLFVWCLSACLFVLVCCLSNVASPADTIHSVRVRVRVVT